MRGASAPVWRTTEGYLVADLPGYCRLPLKINPDTGELRHGNDRYVRDGAEPGEPTGDGETDIAALAAYLGHYRTYGSVFTNFRIILGENGDLIFAFPSGEEQTLHRIDEHLWGIEEMPETVQFDTFVDGKALRAIFSACEYYRTFTE